MPLFPKLLAGHSGSMVDALGYGVFSTLTALMGVPVLILVAARYAPSEESRPGD